ncbi:MAG: PDZ domain-containing protein [Bacillota bacterium]
MSALLELIIMALSSLIAVVINPMLWVVMILVYVQYSRIASLEKQLLGAVKAPIFKRVFQSMIKGLLGGVFATVLAMTLGITIDLQDFFWIFPVAIFLMLINVRYLCFSYSGGILSMISLAFGYPELNVPSIMAIIAILHLIESILIWFDGHMDGLPLFISHKKYGVVGSFTMQRFWPIPFAVFFVVFGSIEGAKNLNLPEWWPLFKLHGGILDIENAILQISLVVAALGYGDIAVSCTPREKSRKSAARLLLFSVILLILAVLSTENVYFQFAAALFAPLAHEALILYGQREEKELEPLFRNYSQGITVMDVLQDGIGQKMGLQPSDIMIKLNSIPIHHEEDIERVLAGFPTYVWIEVQDKNGKYRTIDYQNYQKGIRSLDLVIVPRNPQVVFEPKMNVSIIKKFLDFLRKKSKRR